jgi:hypothetical protein
MSESKAMRRALPSTVKVKDREIKVENLSEKAKKILADLITAEEEIARCSATLRFTEIAHKELTAMLSRVAT